MPILHTTYKPSLLFKNPHFNTSYRTLFDHQTIEYLRKRIATPDTDFLDLDFSQVGSETLVIAMHGLEGSSKSPYIISIVNFLNSQQVDCLALNFRGCSGEDNNFAYSYNSGKTDDLSTVISYILTNYNYKNIILLGYSMGGNITLKYVGETTYIPSEIKASIAISVPCDLEGSSIELSKWYNIIYLKRFLKTLKEKSLLKLQQFPNCKINKKKLIHAKNFTDFDDAVTAPLFNFKNSKDYYTQSSSKQFIPSIQIPTLILNALDDTFLSQSCYPISEAASNSFITLELPKYGGHVGFNTPLFGNKLQWSEHRIYDFIKDNISNR